MRGPFRESRRQDVRLKPGPKPLPPGEFGKHGQEKRALIAEVATRLAAAGVWPSPAAINTAEPSISVGIVGHYKDVLDASRRQWVASNGSHSHWRDPKGASDETLNPPNVGDDCETASGGDAIGVGEAKNEAAAASPMLVGASKTTNGTLDKTGDAADRPQGLPLGSVAGPVDTVPSLDAQRVERLQKENRALKEKLSARDKIIENKDELIQRLLGQAREKADTNCHAVGAAH